eukprot:m.30660 g.30660  ORF g.30660 m.30660 type:complete len:370 (+) comp4801_c0_seq1:11-1120(+)
MVGELLIVLLASVAFCAADVPTVTLFVHADGTGNFSSVQKAINFVAPTPDIHLVLLVRGVFWERVLIPPDLAAITIIGTGRTPLDALIIFNVSGAAVGTFSSWTMRIDNLNATLSNIAIANNASNYDAHVAGQSVALDLRGGSAGAQQHVRVFNCSLLGAQDTLYTGSVHSLSYFYNTYINGSCDALFGESSTVWEACILEHTFTLTAARSGPIVANGTSARAAGPGNVTAYLILNSSITVGPDTVGLGDPMDGHGLNQAQPPSLFLGRPWGPMAQTVVIGSYLGPGMERALWDDWRHNCSATESADWCAQVVYATAGCYGPGMAAASPPSWTLTLTPEQARGWTTQAVLRGWAPWRPALGLHAAGVGL